MTKKQIKNLARRYAVEEFRACEVPDWAFDHGILGGDIESQGVFLAELRKIAVRIEKTISDND